MSAGEELRALVDAYATACDKRDGEAFGSLFASDATLTIYQPFETEPLVTLEGADAMPNAIAPLSQYRATLHLMANHTCEIDGDAASGEVYCLAHHLTDECGGGDNTLMVIRYRDRYTRQDGAWRFARRDVMRQWTEHHAAERARLV